MRLLPTSCPSSRLRAAIWLKINTPYVNALTRIRPENAMFSRFDIQEPKNAEN